MTYNVIKYFHILTVILSVGAFSIQYFILKENLRSENSSMRRASESISLIIGKWIGQPNLLLAVITGVILLMHNISLLKSGIALHIKITLVVLLFGLSHMAARRLKNIAKAAEIQDEVMVNSIKKQLIKIYSTGIVLILAIIALIVIRPF